MKLYLFRDNTHAPKKNLLELINEFRKFARYKINTQKSVVSLYTKNVKFEKES